MSQTHTTPNGQQGQPEQRYCTVAGCTRSHHARGLCLAHYQRRRRHGRVFESVEVGQQVEGERAVQRQCSEPGCTAPHAARGLCMTHYQARRRGGVVG